MLAGLSHGISATPWLHLLWVNTTDIPIAGAIWFLTALFFTDIIYYILSKYEIKWIILPLAIFGCLAEKILVYPLPWALGASFVGLGLYWAGHETMKYNERLKTIVNMPVVLCLILCVLDGCLILMNGYIDMRDGTYAIVPLFWLNAFLSIFIGVSVSKKIQIFVKDTLIEKWLISVGKNSIVYVCCNQLVIKFVTVVIGHINMSVGENIAILIISMTILYGLSVLFTKTKMRFLIGKW